MGGLNRNELTGIILLGLLVVAITGAALLWGGYSEGDSSSLAPSPEITVLDTVAAPASTAKSAAPAREKKKKGRKSKSAARKSSRKVSNPGRQDPFGDTIPTY